MLGESMGDVICVRKTITWFPLSAFLLTISLDAHNCCVAILSERDRLW